MISSISIILKKSHLLPRSIILSERTPAYKSFSALACYRNFQDIQSLQNDYFALRHGQSMANVAGVIASNPLVACSQYGLSPEGQRQAQAAGRDVVQCFERNNRWDGLLVLSSDLLRAKETAQAILTTARTANIPLHNNQIYFQDWLRERSFGEWDGTSDENYHKVWNDDAKDASHTNHGVESVNAVMERLATGLMGWEDKLSNHMIVCVAHGDVLQILQTALQKMDGSLHRSILHLETATLRPLELAQK